MPERSLENSEQFCHDLASFTVGNEREFNATVECVRRVVETPGLGNLFLFGLPLFSGHSGRHYFVICGRFLLVYQYSDTTVWMKSLFLKEVYDY